MMKCKNECGRAGVSQLFGYCYDCANEDTIAAKITARREHLDAIKEGVNYLCRCCNDKELAKDILDAITSQHRTNQQSIFRVLQCVIRLYSVLDKVRWFDGRNEASREWAEKVAQVNHYLPLV